MGRAYEKNLKLIFAALTIKEKNLGKIVHQVPYKLYEFGDITFSLHLSK
jgi:hypothetical protein